MASAAARPPPSAVRHVASLGADRAATTCVYASAPSVFPPIRASYVYRTNCSRGIG
ncbi:unnamed protein product, partial [Nesidiocoris tenuis]